MAVSLKNPLKKRRLREHYSSGIDRDFNGLSVKSLQECADVEALIGAQIDSLASKEDDEFEFDASLCEITSSMVTYARAFYQKEIPPALFVSTVRKNCALVNVFDYCGEDYRFRRR